MLIWAYCRLFKGSSGVPLGGRCHGPCGLVLIAQKIYLQMLRESIFHSILIHVYLSNLKQNLVRHNFVLRNRSASPVFPLSVPRI